MKKRKSTFPCTDGENANWYSHFRRVWMFLKKLTIELPYEPAIPLLGIYFEKIIT